MKPYTNWQVKEIIDYFWVHQEIPPKVPVEMEKSPK